MEKQIQTDIEDGFKLNWTKVQEARKNLEAKEIFKELGIEVFE